MSFLRPPQPQMVVAPQQPAPPQPEAPPAAAPQGSRPRRRGQNTTFLGDMAAPPPPAQVGATGGRNTLLGQ